MKEKAVGFFATIKRYQWAFIGLLSVVVALVIWLAPLQSATVYLRFYTQGIDDGALAHFEIYSDEAYGGFYAVGSPVKQGYIDVKVDHEYISVDRVCITDPQVADAVTCMEVRGNAVALSDYVCASIDQDIIVTDEAGLSILSNAALDTVENGIHNPWMLRVLLTVLCIGGACLLAVYGVVKRRFGTIKALTVVGMAVGCALFVLLFKDLLSGTIPMWQYHIPKWMPVLAIMLIAYAVIVACLLVTKKSKAAVSLIVGVYILALVFSAAKMVFYSERVGNTPDEALHIGYIAQLQQSGDIVPRFEELKASVVVAQNDHLWQFLLQEDSTSYLGHPPLYYHVMRVVGGITFHEDGTFSADVMRLRLFSMAITLAGLAVSFYIGYSRIKARPIVHLLYAAVCTLVPMYAFGSSGVNNDALTFLTIALFFWGILRYLEKKRDAVTYMLIAIGISATVLTKLTAGIVVAVAALIVLGMTLAREKNARELLKPAFLLTLLIYAIPAVYYVFIYVQYGSFRPDVFQLDPEYAYASGFYVEPASRVSHSLISYVVYFFQCFMRTWTGIFSNVALVKPSVNWFSVQNIALVAIWFSPLLFAKRSLRNKSLYSLDLIACYIGIAITLVMQFINGYDGFLSRGYMGGFQSRYYLCVTVMLAFGMAVALQHTLTALKGNQKHTRWLREMIVSAVAIYIGLLFYEDFIYFLLNFQQYIL